MSKPLQRLAKWRSVFSGWQLGTRANTDPESQAVRDHREVSLMLRAEVSALTILLIRKKVFTLEDLRKQVDIEAETLSAMLEKKFPGFKPSDDGMDIDLPVAAETMKNWRP